MGTLEQKSRERNKRIRLENAVLGTLLAAGGLSMVLLAPNALRLLKDIDPQWATKRDPRRRIRESVYRLKKKGLVEFRTESGKKHLRLTKKGEQVMHSVWNERLRIRVPRKWDGKWRLVIFDIPEKRRGTRDKIRILVSRLGFLRLQDSVWVYPYDCEELVTLLKTDLKIGREVLYVIADVIEFDQPLRSHFNLPSD